MKKKVKRKVNRGSHPPDGFIEQKRLSGYALVATVAEEFGFSTPTVYDWIARGKLVSPDSRPTSLKERGCVWVLVDAVKARVAPKAVAS